MKLSQNGGEKKTSMGQKHHGDLSLSFRKTTLDVGGKIVYLECEDKPKLKDFYTENGFVVFGERKLDRDEMDDFEDTYLIQMLKYLN